MSRPPGRGDRAGAEPLANAAGPWRTDRLVGAAVVAALLLRLAFGLGYWSGKPLTNDEREHLLLARSLVRGDGLTYGAGEAAAEGVRGFERAPGYPLFVAAVMSGSSAFAQDPLPSDTPWQLKSVQAGVGALVVWLLAGIAWQMAGLGAARAAACLAAVYPPLVWTPAYVLSETLYSSVALATALVLHPVFARPRPGRPGPALLGGVLSGVATLIRPGHLLFAALAGAWLVLSRRPAAGAILVGATLLTVAPWTARNLAADGRFILVSAQGGITFWTGNHPLARGEGDLAANPELKLAEIDLRRRHADLDEEALDRVYYAEALDYIRSRPLSWLWLEARKLFYLIVPIGPSYLLHSWLYLSASWLAYLSVLPFAVAGTVLLIGRGRHPKALWALALSAVVVCLVFFPQERFRIPVIDPALIASAAAWFGLRRSNVQGTVPP